ncbi:MBL fold metallo-hydrolase [Rhodobacteraceae bacterium NNCM2]|nr:MBL fold metallo-hydrolase [Coraliihabitans acroporae]
MRLFILLVALLMPTGVLASPCLAFVQNWPGGVRIAQTGPGVTTAKDVEITYISHSTFRIRTPEGVVVATDYFGAAGPGPVPDIVTMNHAHETHYTDYPDPAIPHVLRGWKTGGRADHFLILEDIVVRNVPTDLRSFGFEAFGNSIFIFEIGELCLGHLGHLHHEPSEEQYAAIGRLDVVMAPVDGTWTLNINQMIRVLKRIKARVVLPMHAFSQAGLARFVDGMKDEFDIRYETENHLIVAEDKLPARPTVVVLPTRLFSDYLDE